MLHSPVPAKGVSQYTNPTQHPATNTVVLEGPGPAVHGSHSSTGAFFGISPLSHSFQPRNASPFIEQLHESAPGAGPIACYLGSVQPSTRCQHHNALHGVCADPVPASSPMTCYLGSAQILQAPRPSRHNRWSCACPPTPDPQSHHLSPHHRPPPPHHNPSWSHLLSFHPHPLPFPFTAQRTQPPWEPNPSCSLGTLIKAQPAGNTGPDQQEIHLPRAQQEHLSAQSWHRGTAHSPG